jgi:CRP-like cAMP-binding protein
MFLFLLQIDIITSGDHVNELYILVAGMAVGMRAVAGGDGMVARHADSEDVVIDKDNISVHGPAAAPHSQALGPGDTAGEMAFFTETPCMEVRTVHVLAGAVCVDKGGNKGRREEVVAHLCGEVQLL